MRRWGKTSEGNPQWRIGTEDLSDVVFPANDRICTLYRKKVSRRDALTVLVRQSNSMVVEVRFNLTKKDCDAFLAALWEETHFK